LIFDCLNDVENVFRWFDYYEKYFSTAIRITIQTYRTSPNIAANNSKKTSQRPHRQGEEGLLRGKESFLFGWVEELCNAGGWRATDGRGWCRVPQWEVEGGDPWIRIKLILENNFP
jgi:hypothetical protein